MGGVGAVVLIKAETGLVNELAEAAVEYPAWQKSFPWRDIRSGCDRPGPA